MKTRITLLSVLFALVSLGAYAQQTNASGNVEQTPVAKKQKSLKSINWTPRYKGEVNVGYAVAGKRFDFDYSYKDSEGDFDYDYEGKYQTVFSRPLIETIHGVEIGPYFFVGAGVGLQYYCGRLKEFLEYAALAAEVNDREAKERWNAIMLPIFANIKFMYPLKHNLTPFVNLGFGGTICCASSVNFEYSEESVDILFKSRGGFYCDFGAGLRYKMLNFSVGLQHQSFALSNKETENYYGEYFSCEEKLSTKINSFYIKVGVNF